VIDMTALALETFRLTKHFGGFTALDGVSLAVKPGTVHALLGENGAGKSTLVKCIVGYHRPDDGAVMIDRREQGIHSPSVARDLGIGMVYQHFTVVPGMSVAENLLLARGRLPMVVNWKAARAELEAFMRAAPFALSLDATPMDLSAGEKQKLEILKQLFLQPRLLILDEPTSVLTPGEADEVLAALRERAHSGACSVILITHKFREVMAHADEVSVLRRGRLVASLPVAQASAPQLAEAMMGQGMASMSAIERRERAKRPAGPVKLAIQALEVRGDRGEPAVRSLDLSVRAGEIVGVAGVSGNGQRELMQALTSGSSGRLRTRCARFSPRRA
jgi:general nucleoside transport system ATP-binding protein